MALSVRNQKKRSHESCCNHDPVACGGTSCDIPKWLSYLLVFASSASIPLSLVTHSNHFLQSPEGYADGGDLYSHFVEACHVRTLLKQGVTDFWFDGLTLGYPLILAYQPLPMLLSAFAMMITEGYMSGAQTFRFLFLCLLTVMPWTWFLGARRLGMTRLQSSLIAMLVFMLSSWASFGFELGAFRNYGLYSQAYGMALLPLAVGTMFRFVVKGEGSRDATAVFLALTLLCHTLLCIYTLLTTACLLASYFLATLISRQTPSYTSSGESPKCSDYDPRQTCPDIKCSPDCYCKIYSDEHVRSSEESQKFYDNDHRQTCAGTGCTQGCCCKNCSNKSNSSDDIHHEKSSKTELKNQDLPPFNFNPIRTQNCKCYSSEESNQDEPMEPFSCVEASRLRGGEIQTSFRSGPNVIPITGQAKASVIYPDVYVVDPSGTRSHITCSVGASEDTYSSSDGPSSDSAVHLSEDNDPKSYISSQPDPPIPEHALTSISIDSNSNTTDLGSQTDPPLPQTTSSPVSIDSNTSTAYPSMARTDDPPCFSHVICRAIDVHLRSFLLSWWWIVPALANRQYVGGLPWKSDTVNFGFTPSDITKKLLTGEVYDYGRSVPFITLGALTGLAHILLCLPLQGSSASRSSILHTWLLLTFVTSLFLFLGRTTFGLWYDLIPFHSEIESMRYINGLHFIGLLLCAVGLSCLVLRTCALVSRVMGGRVKRVLVVTCLVTTPLLIGRQIERANESLSVSEVSTRYKEAMLNLQEHPLTGRVYGHKEFGVMTYSRGFHDTLSVFYLESVRPDLSTTPWFPHLMQLYNIRYVMAKTNLISKDFLDKCDLRRLSQLHNGSSVFVRSPNVGYGFLEFVRVSGYVSGDLKGMRQTVLSITQIYQNKQLLTINPKGTISKNVPRISVAPMWKDQSFLGPSVFPLLWLQPFSGFGVTWTINRRPVSEATWVKKITRGRSEDSIVSEVLKEKVDLNTYSAIVNVQGQAQSDIFTAEHLLLKVTYHPYWTCRYSNTVTGSSLDVISSQELQEHAFHEYDRWTEVPIHHVTPNLMSIVLPPGRHHVICSFHNPLYQKLAFLMSVLTILMIVIHEVLISISKFRVTK
ncbi:uncharacterized protein LOC116617869 isoform X2 [Nematostella vectensis]|uniref:uncharacterized protein LOC116617869 isoform X2 n=1 Tax=Nematostella vectensis TaxID=45351 RepID=UPI002076F0CE|nr:uncharacterized protein LOC116617869 isoform X2 [Nematostella vectensis]